MPTKNPIVISTEGRNPIFSAVTEASDPSISPVISNPASASKTVVISNPALPAGRQGLAGEKSHIPAQVSNSPVISTTEGRRNPIFSETTPSSHNKPKHFRVTNSDVFYKGKSYPEGSIVDFQDDHLNKYLVPIIEDEITPEDKVYDTSALAPVSMDTSLDPKYVASRRRGRPRQL